MQLQNEVIDMACYFTLCTLTNHKRGIEELQRKVNGECGGIKRKEISTDTVLYHLNVRLQVCTGSSDKLRSKVIGSL